MEPFLHAYIRSVRLLPERVDDPSAYPFSIPAVRALEEETELHSKVTFLVGENGSGKSTIIEALAVAAGFNPEGGSKNFQFSTRSSESGLHRALRLVRGVKRPRDGFFLRAESYFNVGTEIERLDEEPMSGPPILPAYGNVSIHEQSHGESFLRLVQERFFGHGVYVLDEPESALSPQRQLTFLSLLHDLVARRASQFIIATHSPIVMSYPDARILRLGPDGIAEVEYEATEHYRVTRDFLENPARFFKHLLEG